MSLRPEDVFVPGRYPIDRNNAYADRGERQDRFTTALNRLSVPLVYGGYGVGKSSMAMYCAENSFSDFKRIYIESVYRKELHDIFKTIFEDVGYEVAVERVVRNGSQASGELGGEIGANFLTLAKAKAGLHAGTSRSEQTRYEISISGPTDRQIFKICEENNVLLLIDELHRGTQDFINDLSAFIKAYSNSQCSRFRIALLGTSGDPTRLVTQDPGIDRCLTEIRLENLAGSEASQIIAKGMQSLDLEIEDTVKQKIVSSSVGSPFIVQYICLVSSERAITTQSHRILDDHISYALKDYATSKAQRMIREYKAAVETFGKIKYRKNILHAMANIEDEYVTMEQLAAEMSKLIGTLVLSTTLSGPLRQLKSDRYGKILTDIAYPGRQRVHNYSAFRDPAMKSIIRLINSQGIQNLQVP